MLRKLALSLAVAGALSATQANALGLGEIRVNSALNEPLNAEIKLLQVRDLSPLQIQPRMADIDEFSLAGISKSRFLSDVSFDVRVMPDGTGVIRLKSTTPIKEPFLNFLVEVNWPAGRLVREYTLLLDPPVFDPTPVPGVTSVQQAQSTAANMSQPAAAKPLTSKPSRPESRSNIKTRMDPNAEVYVDVHDTLWELALKHRPDSQVTPEQMMLALVRKNPESFPTGNINVMKAGTVMRLPTLDEINTLTPAQAKAEAARQTQVWRQGRNAPKPAVESMKAEEAVVAGKPSEPVKPKQQAAPAEAVETEEPASQLKVVAPEGDNAESVAQSATSDDMSATEQASGDAGQSAQDATMSEQTLIQRNEELENRLLVTQESISVIERENGELNDKVDAIASQLDKLQRLIELKDRELAMMQQQLQQKEAAAASANEGSFIDKVMQSPALLGGIGAGAVAVLLGLLLALRKKKHKEPGQAELVVETDKTAKTDTDAIPQMAAATVAAGAVAAAVSEPEEAKAETPVVEEPPAESTHDEIDDLDLDLDMDMELDLDESATAASEQVREAIDDEEFDLGIDEIEQPSEADESLDSALDDILAGSAEAEAEADIDTGLDDLLSETAGADDFDDDLPGPLDDLELNPESPAQEVTAEDAEDDELDGLDFSIDAVEQQVEDEEDVLELPDDLEFDLAKELSAADEAAEDLGQKAEAEEDDLAGLDFSVDTASTEVSASESGDDFLDDFFAEDPAEKKEGLGSLPETSDDDLEPLTDAQVEIDDDESVGLGTVDITPDDESFEEDDDIEELMQSVVGIEEDEVAQGTSSSAAEEFDDLDAMLASFEPEEDEPVERKPTQSEMVEDELTANIAHDLEMDLDAELDSLLSSTDDEIALEEDSAEELDDGDDLLDSMNLLDGADEIETKLDLARAYIEMEDSDGAKDILNEILNEGSPDQRREAELLLETLN
ncbi:hypothetical protein KQ940_00595 [Marinobacterium sp. D7]|uniref:FimV/HubP family polar landmark protein n=1 Tax=Marinobacterium ramblicola TaxID=2849041 RepID=UPI001C2DE935|nr:FimV/HubP family polar landmark protein [Marinobacterium ramblicola]MBV1786549.1 hypothetical protein [Marinobacterium ramblicola]